MENRRKNLLIGVLLIFFGIIYILKKYFDRYFDFSFGSTIWFLLGFSLFLLYKTKNKKWALIPSGYFIYWGLAQFMIGFGIDRFVVIAGMFFIVPGIVFLILYFDRKDRSYLINSCILLSSGVFIIISRLFQIPLLGLALICAGGGFIFSVIISKIRGGSL